MTRTDRRILDLMSEWALSLDAHEYTLTHKPTGWVLYGLGDFRAAIGRLHGVCRLAA